MPDAAAPSPVTDFEARVLRAIADDPESTLLAAQMVGELLSTEGAAQAPTEATMIAALESLEARGLALRRLQRRPPVADPSGGVPEYGLGRTEVSWWSSTPAGRHAIGAPPRPPR